MDRKAKTLLVILLAILPFFLVFILFPSLKQLAIKETTKQETQPTVPMQEQTRSQEVAKNEIFIFSDRYEPSHLEVKVGETVTWVNKDSKQHVLVLLDPPLQKVIPPGESFSFNTYKACVIEFYDGDNESMQGNITVK